MTTLLIILTIAAVLCIAKYLSIQLSCRLFGDILPFIGFVTWHIDESSHPVVHTTAWKSDCFTIEWFGSGWILFTTNVRSAGKE